ncbi:MAG TPA: hypothetical protein VFA48_03055 [Gammaproteobacteria bacterium]|nr:hypothetical protein [Gammaproteobacteria bacterium]
MTAERRKVLDMLAAGTITPDQAEQLLNRLGPGEEATELPGDDTDDGGETVKDPKKLRHLRVFVDSPNRDNVNIRIPLKLVRTGIKLSALVPGKAGKQLANQGIDLSHLGKLKGAALDEALAELDINIETEKGDKVRVFCE